jgi:hypothetical protein
MRGRGDDAKNDAMIKRETCIVFGSYFAFIFALTFFGPYHGWIYGLVFSAGVTIAMWLVMTFVSVPLPERPECTSTLSADYKVEAVDGSGADKTMHQTSS